MPYTNLFIIVNLFILLLEFFDVWSLRCPIMASHLKLFKSDTYDRTSTWLNTDYVINRCAQNQYNITYCIFILNPSLPVLKVVESVSFNNFFLQQAANSKKPVELISYWHPNLTINLMDDQTPWVQGSVPQPMDECKCINTRADYLNLHIILLAKEIRCTYKRCKNILNKCCEKTLSYICTMYIIFI